MINQNVKKKYMSRIEEQKKQNRNFLIKTGVFCVGGATIIWWLWSGGEEDQWKNSPGTKGHINMDAVKDAIINGGEVKAFEKRINEIFEGDNLIVIKAFAKDDGFTLYAGEDLNKSKKFDAGDDLLFTFSVVGQKRNNAHLKGAGVNRYYSKSFTTNWRKPTEEQKEKKKSEDTTYYHRPYFNTWFFYHGWGSYYTPSYYYGSNLNHRNNYRSSSAFKNQIKKNAKQERSMERRYGSRFRKSVNGKLSSERRSYVKSASGSKDFSSIAKAKGAPGWATRSKLASTRNSGFRSSSSFGRSSSRFGGFRGMSGFIG